ncbi:MAG TPA: hypothetical protein PLA94_24570, partial [Myxococcota bacterium]|nr:hypothetical protein [Myxococcota bacterium]
ARERGELQSLADLLGVPGLGELRLRDLQGLLRSGTPQAGSGDPAGASPPEGDPPGHPIDLPGDHIDPCSLHYSRIERDLVIEGRAGMRVELARIYQFRRGTAPEQWPDDGLPPGWNLCFPRVFRGRLLHAGRALALPSALPFAPPGESITLLQAEAGPSAGWILDEPTLRWWLDAEGRPVRVAQHPDRNAILFQWEQGRLCRIVVAEDDVVEAIWEGTFLCGWRQPAADLTIQFVEEEVDGLRLLRAALDPLERATRYEWQVDVSGARLSRLISPGGGELRLGWQADRIAERMLITNALEGVQTAVCVERWRRESEGEASLTILENGSAVQIYRFVARSSAKGAPMDLASEGTWHGPYLGSPPEAALALRYYLYQRDPLHGHPICIEEYRQGGLTRRTELVYSGEEARWGLPTEVSDLDPDGVLLRRRITLFGAPFPGLPTRLDGDVDVVTTYRYPPDLPLPVLQVEDPDGLAMETESVYDAFGNLVERCFPGEIVEAYSWVPRGALAAVDRGGYTRSVGTNTYEWTEVQSRNSHRWTDPDGGWEQVDYDRLGRPLQRQRSDAPPEQWQYEDATDRRYH